MSYDLDKNKEKKKKYRINIQKNNKNFSIVLYVVQEKLQISIKYSTNLSDEILEYKNFYSYHQLQIINRYFRFFDNLEQICRDLDKLLKNNKISIEEKSDFLILSIAVLIKNEKTNLVFKLLKSKITDFHPQKRDLKSPLQYKDFSKNSLSMPKYNANETKEIKSIINDLNDRLSVLEGSYRKDSLPREYSKNKNMDYNKTYLNNINNMLQKINKLEDLNQEKDHKIKDLEDQINKYEESINNIMSYPVYTLPNKSQKSKNDNNSNHMSNIKKEKFNRNSDEYEVEMNSGFINDNSMNKSINNNEKKLRNKHSRNTKSIDNKSKTDSKYYFKPIDESKEEENNINNNKKQLSNDIKNESNKNLKHNKNSKNKNKSESKPKYKKNESNSIKDENEDEDNRNNKKHSHKRNSYSSNNKENMEDSSYNKKENKKKKEKENQSDSEDNDNKKDKSEISSVKKLENHKKKRNSEGSNSFKEEIFKKRKKNSSSEEKEKEIERSKNLEDIRNKMEKTGLPMVERENLKKYINSRIIYTRKELQMVKNKIIKNKKHLHAYLDLLYRASVDGDYEERINSLCEGKYPQVIFFYTQDGARFGVYIEKEKYTSFLGNVSYKEIPGTSFLISLNSLKTYNILDGKTATENYPEKLCFGRSKYYNNNESNWLIYTLKNDFLYYQYKIGDKESNFGIINTKEIVGIKNEYILEDVEIYQAIIYPEGDDVGNNRYMKEKEIRIKNFSKNKSKKNNGDTIKIRNVKIEKEEREQIYSNS